MSTAPPPQRWLAPAKLNLFLHVVGRRADGYHLLQTVFRLIDLCDELDVAVDRSGRIVPEHRLPGVDPEQDLVSRAARALRQAALDAGRTDAVHWGARIRLTKRIPMGGGLGGGSSDAATTLRALNRLWGADLPAEALERIGLSLGADVPVFLRGRSAWGEGVGEILTPVELPERWYTVVHPGVHVPTAAVFQAPDLTRNTPPTTIPGFFASGGRNDCEPVVRRLYPEVAEALDWLARSAPARLTGTGACVFAEFASAAEAERLAARVPDRWRSFVARGLDRAPELARG